ncbi:hypothetical protein [Amycolatopsis australiensis]|uniref:Uncharacterized protein n=1 Tax=Amycolatopsis australiensis TaxID=546364 RepID=A0A1K1LM90_9PSEU|nr:hypothetical protein [Amycolatopsis australiensis]SFW12016.1 hypothetical protein SAMN04489730_0080 [Amycolatopsis australiensis]
MNTAIPFADQAQDRANVIPTLGQQLEALAEEHWELRRETLRRLADAEARGRYVTPGKRIKLAVPGKAIAGGRVAAAVDVVDDPRALAIAEARTKELHRALAALDPGQHEWRLLAGEVGTDVSIRPALLRRAWNPEETTLFAREVYRAVLDLAGAAHTVRQEIWRRFNAAFQAVAAAKGKRQAGTSSNSLLWVSGTATAQEVMTAPLQTIDTEPAFLAHLRYLLDYSTLSTRTLHAAMAKRVPRVPGHTTLVGWLKGTKLPSQLSESALRAMVEALAENIVENALGAVRQVVDEHVRTYRMLLTQRQGDALLAGPVQRALGVLAEQELDLDDAEEEDRIRREVLHELRERILAELEADRARAIPANA